MESFHKNAILALIGRIHDHANLFIEQELSKHGLSGLATSHGDILASLSISGNLTMSQLTQAVHRKKNTVTVLVAKLQKLGYVKVGADKKDARKKYVSLTKKGILLTAPLMEISSLILKKIYTNFSDNDIMCINNLLSRIFMNIRQPNV